MHAPDQSDGEGDTSGRCLIKKGNEWSQWLLEVCRDSNGDWEKRKSRASKTDRIGLSTNMTVS